MDDQEFNALIEALKTKALGNVVTTTIEQYKKDNEGNDILSDRTIKKIMNDIDTQACIKLIDIELKRRELERNTDPYAELSDEELEQERQRMLAELQKVAFSNDKG